jgi:HEPN domain-containing protein
MATLGFEEALWNQVCFHSHQATEKSLKALFAYEGDLPPRTHRLTNLSKSLEDRYPSLGESADDLLVLENYYIPSRYPDATPGSLPEGLPGREDAERALAAARRVSEFVGQTVRTTG